MTFIFPIENLYQRAIVICGIVFSVIPAVFVGLRVLARRKANRVLDVSDYMVMVSCVLAIIFQGVSVSAVLVGGVGFHIDEIVNRFGVESGPTLFYQHLIPLQLLWAISLGLCRISILHLFSRIFLVQNFFIVARATYVLIITWTLAAVLSAFLICRPLSYNWDKSVEGGVCGNQVVSWVVTGALNMVSDLIILIVPMPYLLRLELALPKRLSLAATFGIGILTCVVSIIRVALITKVDFTDITWSISSSVLVSALEPCVAVTVACAIILRPLFGGQYSPDGTATFNTPSVDALSRKNSNRRFKQLNDDSSETRLRPEELGYRASIAKASEPFKGQIGDIGLEMGSISIKHEWIVKEEQRPATTEMQQDKS
ncbi:hypothetical protein GGS23DRAFT_229983 [Durotheca rogersii]|uniref:uncharacterized protein n=1 Tax=Durotheca rogersii TaxID=419775 RepID=UPI002220D2A7|nr:uncharacterized protein GGS23DRAFT_229983 [Durotheca rogersii]KAI5860583.1 hypothetical protein GGS23DRAFT_229983 [Durotheca rogersii]